MFTFFSIIFLILQNYNSIALSPRACVIGAGYAGIGTARYLKEYGVDFTLFEATQHVGGIWRYNPQVGVDEDGVPIMTHAYENLRVNTPKQSMEYYDFPFPEGTSTYVTGDCFLRYIKSFVNRFNLLENIQFQSYVTSVKWAEDKWNLTYVKTDTREIFIETCDYVVVTVGLYNKPKIPFITGQELFEGTFIHSSDYRSTEPYRNRRVLVIGAGASGMDISVLLSNVTAALYHSHHRDQNDISNSIVSNVYHKKPDVLAFTANGAIFTDNSFEEIDDVILCSGYSYFFPFLDSSSGLIIGDYVVAPLYRQIVNINHPSMFIIGITKGIIIKAIDAQAHYAATVIARKFHLPSEEVMMRAWVQGNLWKPLIDFNVVYNVYTYYPELAEGGVPAVPPVYGKISQLNQYQRNQTFITFRDYEWDILDDYNFVRYYAPSDTLSCPIDV